MKITRHKLAGAKYVPSPNFTDNIIVPKFIVMHYTASLKAGPSINWLSNPDSKVSAHLVIASDGTVTQMVDFNKKAWHAGASYSQGYKGLNNHSIGIELVNPGVLTLMKDRTVLDAYGRKTGLKYSDLESVKSELYLPYSDEQLDVLQEIVIALTKSYPTIFDCVGHQEIDTRGKKKDPGPLFPMQRYDSLVSNNSHDGRVFKTVSRLNVRTGPASSYPLSRKPLKKGDEVEEIRLENGWMLVEFGSKETGYVSDKFLRRIR